MKTLLLIDGNSILNRAFYGIRPLTTSKGLYTHAVYGMANIVLRHLEDIKPEYAAVAFDVKAPTFRHRRYDGYKATRKGMPEELAVQLPYAKQCMAALGFRVLELPGYEADDILGTCAAFGREDPGLAVDILTGDRDSLQLIRDNVAVLLAGTEETVTYRRDRFFERYGITPEQFVDVKALMGDSSDNIPGVPGIGEKTALKLISSFGSLDEVYRRLDGNEIAPAVVKKLEAGRESAYLSQELAQICCDAPLGISMAELRYDGFDRASLRSLLTELELSSLLKRLGLDREEESAGENGTVPAAEPMLPAVSLTPERLAEKELRYCSVLFSDSEMTVYDGKQLYRVGYDDPSEVAAFFSDPGRTVIVSDSKKLCLTFGKPACQVFDTVLAAYVDDPSESNYDLHRLSVKYLGRPNADEPTRLLYELAPVLNERLKETGQSSLYYQIEEPLAYVLAEMERCGFRVDREGLAAYSDELHKKCDDHTEAIYAQVGHPFNINSTKQLGEVLFGELELPILKKTKTGYSTDAETLDKLRPYHPIIDAILEYRQVAKLRSTYCEGLLKVADEEGRVHSSFNQTVTATGRLSSSEPNLQNIPIRTETGRRLRKFFLPKNSDYVLVDADYSQIELRVLAAVSGDEHMIRAFAEGEDIHTMTAASVFGVSPEEVTEEQRKRAKAVNFGIVYGISAFSLGNDIGVSKYEADRYIRQYLARYPGVSAYLEQTVEKAGQDGYVTTIFGRRRYIPELSSPKKQLQAFGKRVAMNSPIQGAAADIIKIAMIRVAEALEKSGIDARLILQVHDELILEAHHSCAKEAADLLKREMESAVTLPVPLSVDIGIGDNWYEC